MLSGLSSNCPYYSLQLAEADGTGCLSTSRLTTDTMFFSFWYDRPLGEGSMGRGIGLRTLTACRVCGLMIVCVLAAEVLVQRDPCLLKGPH